MNRTVKFLRAAENEAQEAMNWYEDQERGLGKDFLNAVDQVISNIQKNPFAFPNIHGSPARRALTGKFPYSVIFSLEFEWILIISIFHSRRDPMVWRDRT